MDLTSSSPSFLTMATDDFGFDVIDLVEDEAIFEGPGALAVGDWHKENIRVLRLVLANGGASGGANSAGDGPRGNSSGNPS